jgi:hypothetical protein
MSFRVSNFRDVGMPTRKIVDTAEEGFAWAEAHGFRGSAYVEPISAGAHMSSSTWLYREPATPAAALPMIEKAA